MRQDVYLKKSIDRIVYQLTPEEVKDAVIKTYHINTEEAKSIFFNMNPIEATLTVVVGGPEPGEYTP